MDLYFVFAVPQKCVCILYVSYNVANEKSKYLWYTFIENSILINYLVVNILLLKLNLCLSYYAFILNEYMYIIYIELRYIYVTYCYCNIHVVDIKYSFWYTWIF